MAKILIVCALASSVINAAASDAITDMRSVSINTLNAIERINEEIVELRMELAKAAEDDSAQMDDIENLILEKQKQMASLGAGDVDDELFVQLIQAALDADGNDPAIEAYAVWHPSELIEQFKELYDIYCLTISLAVKPDCITLTGSIA